MVAEIKITYDAILAEKETRKIAKEVEFKFTQTKEKRTHPGKQRRSDKKTDNTSAETVVIDSGS